MAQDFSTQFFTRNKQTNIGRELPKSLGAIFLNISRIFIIQIINYFGTWRQLSRSREDPREYTSRRTIEKRTRRCARLSFFDQKVGEVGKKRESKFGFHRGNSVPLSTG